MLRSGLMEYQCVKSVQTRIFSGPCFPVLGLIRENTEQKNPVFGHFSRSVYGSINSFILYSINNLLCYFSNFVTNLHLHDLKLIKIESRELTSLLPYLSILLEIN